MRITGSSLLLALTLMPPLPAVAQGNAANSNSFGVWRNPKNSVHVSAQPCGQAMCGVVVWANDKAKADAARGGTPDLIGKQLFRDFRKQSATVWRGRVFVPDINKTFSGTVTVLNANTLRGRGCLVGGVGCKSQTWTRIK